MSLREQLRADRTGNKAIATALKSHSLAEGAHEGAVKWMERMLQLAGFNPGRRDASFTEGTTRALKEFQASRGLPATGALDPKTFAHLKAVQSRVRAKPGHPVFGVGQKDAFVARAERRLRTLGYDTGAVDGIFDRRTAKAVEAFKKDQKDLGRSPLLGAKALGALSHETQALAHTPYHGRVATHVKAHRRLDKATAAAAARVQPDGTAGLAEGAKGRAVTNVQSRLRAAGFDPKRTDGVFDERTAAALKALQHRSGLPANGQVDPATWAALSKSVVYAKGKFSPAQTLNENSAAVLKSEQVLRKLGYKNVKVDGVFDQATLAASRAFERHHKGTGTDGAIGAGQYQKMVAALKAKQSGGGAAAIAIAHKFLGFHERGVNGNPFSTYFHRKPEAWCADFVSYCFEKAGHPIGQKGVGICYVPTLANYFKAKHQWHQTPKVGAVITFNGYAHTGIVTAVKNGMVYTIEGNSSDGVHERAYPVGSPSIDGYGY